MFVSGREQARPLLPAVIYVFLDRGARELGEQEKKEPSENISDFNELRVEKNTQPVLSWPFKEIKL